MISEADSGVLTLSVVSNVRDLTVCNNSCFYNVSLSYLTRL